MTEVPASTTLLSDVRSEPMGVAEVAKLLDVSRQRVDQLSRQKGFPKPIATLSTGRVWDWADIVKWARSQGRDVK